MGLALAPLRLRAVRRTAEQRRALGQCRWQSAGLQPVSRPHSGFSCFPENPAVPAHPMSLQPPSGSVQTLYDPPQAWGATKVPTPGMLLAWEARPQTPADRAWPGQEHAQLGVAGRPPAPDQETQILTPRAPACQVSVIVLKHFPPTDTPTHPQGSLVRARNNSSQCWAARCREDSCCNQIASLAASTFHMSASALRLSSGRCRARLLDQTSVHTLMADVYVWRDASFSPRVTPGLAAFGDKAWSPQPTLAQQPKGRGCAPRWPADPGVWPPWLA